MSAHRRFAALAVHVGSFGLCVSAGVMGGLHHLWRVGVFGLRVSADIRFWVAFEYP